MILKKIILYLFILFSLSLYAQFDKAECDILNLLVQKHAGLLKITPPPFPDFILNDSTTNKREEKKFWKQEKRKNKIRQTMTYDIILIDTLFGLESDYLINEVKELGFDIDFKEYSLNKELNFCSIKLSKEFKRISYNKTTIDSLFAIKLNQPIEKDAHSFAGIMSFSQIVFNKSEDKAFVKCDLVCGRLCGSSFLIILSFIKNKWVVIENKLISIH